MGTANSMDWATLETRIERVPFSGCWVWTGSGNSNDYGVLHVTGQRWMAHRLAFVLTKGAIQDDLLVCHTCDVPPCLNPDHLFLGTTKDNVADSLRKGRFKGQGNRRSPPEFCKAGHRLTNDNIYKRPNGLIQCRICRRVIVLRWDRTPPPPGMLSLQKLIATAQAIVTTRRRSKS